MNVRTQKCELMVNKAKNSGNVVSLLQKIIKSINGSG